MLYTNLHYQDKGRTSSFITLTVEDGFSDTTSIRRQHIQKFFKRLRHHTKLEFKMAYLGDYGETTQRPHYHALLFGVPDEIATPYVTKSWQHGFTDVEPLASANVNYVVNYINKVQSKQWQEHFDALNIERPFFTHSRGLSNALIERNIDTLTENGTYLYQGKYYRLPLYHLAKLGLVPTKPDLSRFISEAHRAGYNNVEKYLEKKSLMQEKNALHNAQNKLKPPQGVKNLPNKNVPTGKSRVTTHDINQLIGETI